MIEGTEKYKHCNHHHELTEDQEIVDFGSGKFVADKKRIALLKALNDCGLITRTHCYGHETGRSFVSIILDEHSDVEFRNVNEGHSTRKFPQNTKEVLISWKRTD